MLLAGFLLIALVLAAAAVQGLHLLESFAQHSRRGADAALGLTSAAQQLGERTVDMERSARQFLVLGDSALKARFMSAREGAESALGVFSATAPATLGGVAEAWRSAAGEAEATLETTASEARLRDALDRLHRINERLAQEARLWVARENAALLNQLETNRLRLAWQVLLAVLCAAALAAFFGWQLARPVRQIEAAIECLGDAQLTRPVEVEGPADLRRLGQRLDWLRQRLGELEADRVRMLRHVSHELKTPLAALREGVALLDDEVTGDLSAPQREVVSILRANAHLLQGRIEDLLGFNAAVFDARRLHRSVFVLGEALERVVEAQRLQAQAGAVTVRLEVVPVSVEADADKMAIAFGNLLANAISFSPPGSEVVLRVRRDGDWASVECIDAGPGVDEADVARIFDPFFQGRRQPATRREGSGIGLSIVREYVQAHGGRVALVPGERGAHFRIDLPLST